MEKLQPNINLPMHILESEILPRLPAKSIGQFMSVCKQWHSLLSTQDFRKKNLYYITTSDPRTHQKLVLLEAGVSRFSTLDAGTTPADASVTSRSTAFGSDYQGAHIVATLDGLVCVSLKSTQRLMFWNPLTGDYKILSNSHLHRFDDIFMDVFGFYCDESNDYKLLHLVRVEEGPVYIYSRRLDSWRRILSFSYAGYLCWPKYQWSPGTYVGQSLYFTVVSKEHSCIIGFDVKLETFREICFPSEVSGGEGFNGTLVAMNGCVHLCVPRKIIDGEFYMPCVDIDLWRMDGGDGWMKVAAYRGNENIPLSLTPNCIVRQGKWDVTWVFNKALVKVDTTNDKHEFTYIGGSLYDLVRALYIETLLSPKIPNSTKNWMR